MSHWRDIVAEIPDRAKLEALIASGSKHISAVAALRGVGTIGQRYDLVLSLVASQAAFKEQLAERFPDNGRDSQ